MTAGQGPFNAFDVEGDAVQRRQHIVSQAQVVGPAVEFKPATDTGRAGARRNWRGSPAPHHRAPE